MKLFNQKKNSKMTDTPLKEAVVAVSYYEQIARIHNEFNTAGENIYQEALAIINETIVPNQEKAVRLEKMGFYASKEATAAKEAMVRKQENERIAKIIKYYRDKYPLYKFIRDKDVEDICEKYGLIYGSASQYTGFIPEKNLKSIESFKIDDRDRRVITIGGWIDKEDSGKGKSFEDTQRYWELRERRNPNMSSNTEDDIVEIIQRQSYAMNSIGRSHDMPTTGFSVVAPANNFKIESNQEIKKYKITNKPIPDPVVLCAVAEGYLIVTAWGDEASDPIVQNELNN
jgi:hypothetical protein